MIRFHYSREVQPPAPFVWVEVVNPLTGVAVERLPALVDTGADRTVLPLGLAEALELNLVRAVPIAGLGGDGETLGLYPAWLTIPTLDPFYVIAVGHPRESHVILGRDILNRLRMVFDGPNLTLEIG